MSSIQKTFKKDDRYVIYLFHIGEQHEQSACLGVPKVKKVLQRNRRREKRYGDGERSGGFI